MLVLAVALLVTACDGSSPTEPRPTEAGGVRVVINDPAGAFAAHHALIRTLIEDTVAQVRTQLSVRAVTIEVTADRARSIGGLGVGGYTVAPTRVEMVVDPTFAGLEASIRQYYPAITAHELHHTARWSGTGFYSTLLEAMVSEGLAERFVGELFGSPPQPWSEAFPESQTQFWLDRARPEFDSFYDFNAWFLGSDPNIPRWAGYTLGFRLVRDFQARDGRSAAQLVTAPADVFRPQ